MNRARGIAWWETLHWWQKMAVVLSFPFDTSAEEIGQELELGSRNRIISTRRYISQRRRLGAELPQPCSPEEAQGLSVPEHIPPLRGKKPYVRKPQRENGSGERKKLLGPSVPEKPRPCCEKDCDKYAVPKLAFCVEHARAHYTMTPQIEALIAAATSPTE